jgi:hypothetical protein
MTHGIAFLFGIAAGVLGLSALVMWGEDHARKRIARG